MSINMGRRIKKIKKKELTHIWQRKASVALSKEVPAWRCSHLSRRDQRVQHCWVEYGTDKYKLILKILYISLSAASVLFLFTCLTSDVSSSISWEPHLVRPGQCWDLC